MFLLTQFIGIYVVNHYLSEDNELPFGLHTPEIEKESDYKSFFYVILFAFAIAIFLLFLLTKIKARFILKAWFFIVVTLALGIALNSFFSINYAEWIALAIALPLAFFKIFQRNFLVHNATELLIYPGIAVIFIPILNFWTILVLLMLISVYDIWAVWHSGIMQKMAKYQINKLKIFSGFFVPYVSKKMRLKLKKMKQTLKKSKLKKKKIRINVAILGGGDVVFPIIAMGVILHSASKGTLPQFLSHLAKPLFGIPGLATALFVIAGATLGLSYLFFFSEKKKFYPAMPFITAGIILGMVLSYLIL